MDENKTLPALNAMDKLRAVVARLNRHYGSSRIECKTDPLDELFFLLLNLKTSTRTYQETYEHFYAMYHPWEKLLEADPQELETYIRRGGHGSIKTRAFIDIARRLKDNFGTVSLELLRLETAASAEKYLMSLPSVGLKTARCVMMYSLGMDVLPVDAHTYRVGARIGIVPTSRNTNAVHESYDRVLPPRLAYHLHTNFVMLGREYCLDQTPRCAECPVCQLCEYSKTLETHRNLDLPKVPTQALQTALPQALRVADIYAGCGGLSAGLRDAGFHVAYSLDWDAPACRTHRENFPETVVECTDVRQVTGRRIEDVAGGSIDLVVGGPNCQGVSERGLRNPDDPRNFMFPEFVRLVSELRPRAFIMENVPGLAHRQNFDLLRSIFASFGKLGYRCAGDVLLAASYGVPQLRYRFFLIGVLGDGDITLPAPTHHPIVESNLFDSPFITLEQAIGDLPRIGDEPQREYPRTYVTKEPKNDFQRYVRGTSDCVNNHVCSATQMINLERAKYVPVGGNWKDIPAELLPGRFFRCRMTDHSTTYARLRWDRPAYTITAAFGNITAGAFTHPTENRALTIREGARLQSFSDNFVFYGPRNSQYRQIGNAVPPLLAKAVGAHLLRLLGGEVVGGIRPRIDEQLLSNKRAWDSLPVLCPRFKASFGEGTRWPKGWGKEPENYSDMLDNNYSLKPAFWPPGVEDNRRNRREKPNESNNE